MISFGRRRQYVGAVPTDHRGDSSSFENSITDNRTRGSNNVYSPRGSSSSQQTKGKMLFEALLNLTCPERGSSGDSKYHPSPNHKNKTIRTYLLVAAFCGFVILSNFHRSNASQEEVKVPTPSKSSNQSNVQQQQQKSTELRESESSKSETKSQESSTPIKLPAAHQEMPVQAPQQLDTGVTTGKFLVDENDYIYKRDLFRFDAAPIILPEYKLVFFSIPKVACTTFKFLFRRIMGIKDWKNQDFKLILPHNPKYNNLKYLWDYSLEEANEMMTSPEWTRAIFVREPKNRLLSAFLDKAIGNDGWHVLKRCCHPVIECRGIDTTHKDISKLLEVCHLDAWDSRRNVIVPQWNLDIPCCKEAKECRETFETFEGFMETIKICHDEHWDPQSHRMEAKYWKYINFVGHMESMKNDTRRLLEKIGAWDKWGATGWGPHGNSSIVDQSEFSQSHTTGSSSKIYQWYTPERERLVEAFYAIDYNNPLFNFERTNLTEPYEPLPDGEFIKRDDRVYSKGDWDGSPIVVEKYKLIFFTVPKIGATKWKQAFRRMMGLPNWREIGGKLGLPHNPWTNGLKYLYDYPIEEAEVMFKSGEWTKAIFIRSPKDRFLSVYTEMSRDPEQVDRRCCPHDPGCSTALRTIAGLLEIAETCYSTHWAPITDRMEEKYWPYINFVGSLENAEADSQKLLERIGAWDEIGRSGWGENGGDHFFARDENAFNSVLHSLSLYNPAVDKQLDEFYKVDFESNYFTFASNRVYAMEH
ncbi:sulfotransferase family protein [Nitzschia inconspicua]|uniref:Sulfotransferase family protein n=1 Tax=Nitzschia inconspicua TaxID=303405 RepID=A0A9K3LKH9_9STRA|nr:sulfotransferase family protein [Nitzschia inconspicua]KAG7364130.1 sulfotransferase family protein [Nitzschia inconspicua]